jgi:hypothetical protein
MSEPEPTPNPVGAIDDAPAGFDPASESET